MRTLVLLILVVIAISASAQTLWYCSPTGTGDGSLGNPSSFATALTHVSTSVWIVCRGGLYVQSTSSHNWGNGYTSTDSSLRAVIRAYPGERPIFTQTDSVGPALYLYPPLRLVGLWFGTKTQHANHPINKAGPGVDLDSCVFIGYGQAVNISQDFHRSRIRYNLFLGCGDSTFWHAVYYSDSVNGGKPNYTDTTYHNVIVGGNGYGLHGWHGPSNWMCLSNFVADQWAGNAMDGKWSVFRNNIFHGWNEEGLYFDENADTYGHIVPSHTFVGMRRHGGIQMLGPTDDGFDSCANNTVVTMANGNYLSGTCLAQLVIDSTQVASKLGLSSVQIDSVVSVIVAMRDKNPTQILNDTTIQGAWSRLNTVIDTWSGISGGGGEGGTTSGKRFPVRYR
jgi:hypothetical protein